MNEKDIHGEHSFKKITKALSYMEDGEFNAAMVYYLIKSQRMGQKYDRLKKVESLKALNNTEKKHK